ncbi:iron-containing alcohol dehydrogenase [Xenorhabdus sp. Flor]|uniref:3-dehydroquinate synthase family protein n=1 Tax=Xenorhabdus cabanillasii TaxID=351673 RepID=UPI0019C22DB8|nr:iron-containing alcohol dehydrogenase [Xenorhabdus sp. Flor]MBD2816068.1 iron-containing alcohol dehydrogenase [Xenorhabdus sp. Flor]
MAKNLHIHRINNFETTKLTYSFIDELFSSSNTEILDLCVRNNFNQIIIYCDSRILELYPNIIKNFQLSTPLNIAVRSIDIDTNTKSMTTVEKILMDFEESFVIRGKTIVVALGGGTLMDVVSFAASIYHRKIDHIRIPTTLLGMVDAGHGIKNGINFNGVKNRIGTYSCPIHTFIDKSFLSSLPMSQVINGLGEVIKIAISKDKELFDTLLKNDLNLRYFHKNCPKLLDLILSRSIDCLVSEIALDPWEINHKRVLDFGHIVSPFFEAESGWKIDHGIAVAAECFWAATISRELELLSNKDMEMIAKVYENCGINLYFKFFTDPEIIKHGIKEAIKHRSGHAFLPHPKKIGELSFINDLDSTTIEKFCRGYCDYFNFTRNSPVIMENPHVLS